MKKIEDVLSYSTLDEINDLSVIDIQFVINYLKSSYREKINSEICSYKKQINELEILIDKLENGPDKFDDDDIPF